MMKWIILLSVLLISCKPGKEPKTVDVQGHRGARGLAPENSFPAFIKAVDLGVSTLELDLVVSKDMKLVVSHEPYFSPNFCQYSNGRPLLKDSIINIYQLSYEEVLGFDCGSKGNSRFPSQQKSITFKPLLSEVIDSVESYAYSLKKKLNYNIELKTLKATDDVFHPSPEVFSDLVFTLIREKDILERVTIQSFDFRTLQYFQMNYPSVDLALLIENNLDWRVNIDSLGFKPNVYSPFYQLLSREIVNKIQSHGMKVVPWTVNEKEEIREVLSWDVDGIISDYPDRAITEIKSK